MPKRKSSAYYLQIAKRRFSSVDSMHSHVGSPRVSLDTLTHVDSPCTSVYIDTASRIESSTSNSSGTYSNPFRICLHQSSIDSVT